MRIVTMTAIWIAATGISAPAEERAEAITVYLHDHAGIPNQITYSAKAIASNMFAAAGIHVEWRTGKAKPAGGGARPIEISFEKDARRGFRPGTLAYALPFEGAHIRVFYDRVQEETESNPSWLLAHVLVHEITHILQGLCHHSPEGIMKAQWTASDIAAMRCRPLRFTPDDIELIRAGMAFRAAGPVAAASLESAAVSAR